MMMRADMMVLGTRLRAVEDTMKAVATATMSVARQEVRIDSLEQRTNLLSHRLDELLTRRNHTDRD
jgi:hypothetical protein